VDNTRDYARVSHSRQWSNYNLVTSESGGISTKGKGKLYSEVPLTIRLYTTAIRSSVK